MDTVLVTGGAGFIGSHVVRKLIDGGYRVVCVDNFNSVYDPAFKEENIAPLLVYPDVFKLERVDIRDKVALKVVFEKEKPVYVIHLAALADTRNAVDVPGEYVDVNINGTLNVLDFARDYKVKNVALASSSSVYGNTPRFPWVESENADMPLSPYGATKRAIELFAYAYHHNFGLNVTCLRYFNAYGENNRPGMVPYVWTNALLTGKEIEISGDGSRKRDYTYVGDVADATILAMQKPLGYEILNIGNSNPISLVELLVVLEKATGKTATRKMRPSHSASVETTCADISKAKKLIGWEPKVSLEEGMGKLVEWFREKRIN
ncbi:MAG: NAD-dependent epimerase/dehydratase family protein [Patescibacteria group bacterium]